MFRRCSSEDSELSDSVINSKSAIRVSVCLQRFFKDVRARCYILVIRNRRVRWLEKRLRKIFSLPGGFCLCANGHLLPSSEPLALLRPEDSIEVIPLLEVHMGILHNNETLISNDNNNLEKHSQNEEKVSESPHTHCGIDHFASVSNHSQSISEEANYNRTLKTQNEVAGTSKFGSIDDIDGTRTSNKAQGPINSVSTINNNNIRFADERNRRYETKDTAHTIQQLKRRALALLDAQRIARDAAEAAIDEQPPRRVRRRVRRRARRNPQPEAERVMELEPEPEPEEAMEPEAEGQAEPDPESRSSAAADSLSESDQPLELEEAARAPSPAAPVARNDAARSRPPRVVRALDAQR